MCGILGIQLSVNSPEILDEGVFRTMLARQSHRGPDSDGIRILNNRTAFGHNRLSIIDLSERGHQPMTTSDDKYSIVYNGEVYNFKEIRERLQKLGYTFNSETDTEVLLYAYIEYGTDMLEHINGMFAFAIYDLEKGQIFLARDRFGQKPLFFYHDDQRFVFASEMNTILAWPGLNLSLNHHAIDLFLSLQYIPAPYSVYSGIEQLQASQALVYKEGEISKFFYHDVNLDKEIANVPYDEAKKLIREKVSESVRKRMISDVPLGAFLSGGIDSSIITSILARSSNKPVSTVSVGFNEREYSELDKAKSIADKYKTDHHEYILDMNEAGSNIEKIVASYGQPFGDSSAIPTYFLSKQTRSHVTVALSGDGGDELFCGYQRYHLDRKFNKMRSVLPGFVLAPFFSILGLIPPKKNVPIEKNWSLGLKRLSQVNAIDKRASILRWGSYFNYWQKMKLYNDYQARVDHAVRYLSDIMKTRTDIIDFTQRTQYSDIYSYAPGDYLVKTDIASMQHSLEVRSPLLDHELVNMAFSINPAYSRGDKNGKRIFKDAFANDLTDEVLHGPKRGFSVPASEWFKGIWLEMLNDYINSKASFCKEYFNLEYINKMIKEHINNHDDHSKRLYLLLVLEIWNKQISIK